MDAHAASVQLSLRLNPDVAKFSSQQGAQLPPKKFPRDVPKFPQNFPRSVKNPQKLSPRKKAFNHAKIG